MATTPVLNSLSLSQYTDLITRSFDNGLKSLVSMMRKSGIVVENPMPMHTGDTRRFGERLHMTQYASKRDEGSASSLASVQYGYEKDLTIYTISLAVSITERMRSAGKNQEILDKITKLVNICPETIDLDLTHRLTFATATTYTDRDGDSINIAVGDTLALLSAVHTLTGSSTTYSNIISGNPQFSKGTLENAEKLFAEETFDNLGIKMAMKGKVIITTDDPNTNNAVRELLGASADITSSNSGTINVYKNGYKHVSLPRLATTAAGAVDSTKRKYRFLASEDDSDFYLSVLKEPYLKTPSAGNNGEDLLTENRTYTASATIGMTIVTGRRIKGSTGL